MGVDREFAEAKGCIEIQRLRANASASGSINDWRAVRSACDESRRQFPNAWILAWWWVQASSELERFQGLTDGVNLLVELCRKSEPPEFNLYDWLQDKLRQAILSVPLSPNAPYTYTTVFNARVDPERAAATAAAVTASETRKTDLNNLEALAAALRQLKTAVQARNGPSYSDLVELAGRIGAYMTNPPEPLRRTEPGTPDESSATPTAAGEPPSFERPANVYLQLEGFKGESTAANHPGWIVVQSYRHNMQPPSPSIVIRKALDAASPKLYRACCTGRTFTRAVFDICREPGDAMCVLRVELSDATISSVTQETAPGSVLPVEEIMFRFAYVQWIYTQFGLDQSPEGVVAASSRPPRQIG